MAGEALDASRQPAAPGLRGVRRPRRGLVAIVGHIRTSDRHARAVADSLAEHGISASFLGRVDCPAQLATTIAHEDAGMVELFLASGRGVAFLRDLLRELGRVGRQDVSIVVHRLT